MSSYGRKRTRSDFRPASSLYRPRKRTRPSSRYLTGYRRAPLASRGYNFPSPELKFLDVASTGAIAFGSDIDGSTGSLSIVLLNGSAPGTGATTRIGRKITMKSMLMRVYYDSVPTSTSGIVRTLIVYDMQSNGVAPTASELFLNGSSPKITMPMNLDNRDRFRVIHDKARYLSNGGTITDTNQVFYKKYFKWKKGLDTVYNSGSAGTVADIQTGALYLIVFTCCGTANIGARIETRIRFADM